MTCLTEKILTMSSITLLSSPASSAASWASQEEQRSPRPPSPIDSDEVAPILHTQTLPICGKSSHTVPDDVDEKYSDFEVRCKTLGMGSWRTRGSEDYKNAQALMAASDGKRSTSIATAEDAVRIPDHSGLGSRPLSLWLAAQ